MPTWIWEISLDHELFPGAIVKIYSCADISVNQKQVKVKVVAVILVGKKLVGFVRVKKERKRAWPVPRTDIIHGVRIELIVRQENATGVLTLNAYLGL